jgi:hypothetical protein
MEENDDDSRGAGDAGVLGVGRLQPTPFNATAALMNWG